MSGRSEQWEPRDVVDLIEACPLAWLVSSNGGWSATPLPVLVETDSEGRPVTLLGHFAKSNPQVDQIRANPRILFLFQGPQAYISPELVSDRDWAPTWNYVVLRVAADVRFDESLNDEALSRLVAAMERGRPRPWAISEMGPRYEQLKQRIIAFRATITNIQPRFKLGQDERPEVLTEILEGLGEVPLADWMRRFNGARPIRKD